MRNEQRDGRVPSFPWISLATAVLAIASGLLWLVPIEIIVDAISIGDGESARVLASKIRQLLLPGCAIGLVVSAMSWTLRSRAEAFYQHRLRAWFDGSIDDQPANQSIASLSRSEHLFWALWSIASVLAYDWRTLFWGYFESDDYFMVGVARDGNFPGSLLSTHNDHVLPLLRLEYSFLYEIFATNPFAYNLGVLLSFSLMLYSGCILLRECTLNRISTFVFLFLCINWSLWGEFTAGSYILQKYMQITTCGLLGCWSWIRWEKTQRRSYFAGCVLAVLVACLMNPSGYWVPCAVLVFAAMRLLSRPGSNSIRETFRDGRAIAFAVIGVVAISMAVYRFAYSLPGNDEFLTLTDEPLTLTGFAQQFFLFVSTLIVTVCFPLPHHVDKVGLLLPFLLSVSVAAAAIFICSSRALTRELKATTLAIILIMLGIITMVCLGRPIPGFDYIVAAKYLGPAYVWLCLTASFCVQGFWNATSSNNRLHWRLTQTLVGFLAIALLGHGAVELGARAELPFLDRDVSRNGKLREQIRERRAVGRLRDEVISPLEQDSPEDLRLPNLSGDAIAHALPELAFPWGERPSLRMLVPLLESRPRSIVCVPLENDPSLKIRDSISPSFIKLLHTNDLLREIAFTPLEIESRSVNASDDDVASDVKRQSPDQSQPLKIVSTDESLMLQSPSGSWDPTRYPNLRLRVLGRESLSLRLVVHGEFDTRVHHQFSVDPASEPQIDLALSTLLEYSCSKNIASLELAGADLGKLALQKASLVSDQRDISPADQSQ
ncbi:hypothetical protein [Rhodopirellula bahusiensis]|uniref:Glycosyltransferase RgtA/B/C/D-like domain-containing protein n=1 Tax=Rhodopirellula bahusiensis TaxID=2014065 RepID=A0A2G1W5G9_9BACT|nr:hypothetical protein [Rhodopirellula bahusiensis]PHQ34293.1 hypothetical protein CEE69_16175 [Rhodopirellula bahusiensis]